MVGVMEVFAGFPLGNNKILLEHAYQAKFAKQREKQSVRARLPLDKLYVV
jgi:hypothetical protein